MIRESIRKAKLHGKYHRRVKHWNGGRDLPWLNVSGVWLERAGFKVGDAVEITVKQNTLTIKNRSTHGTKAD